MEQKNETTPSGPCLEVSQRHSVEWTAAECTEGKDLASLFDRIVALTE